VKIYLAGSEDQGQIVRVKRWSAKLTEAGWDVISTWVASIENNGGPNRRDALSRDRRSWACTCMIETRQADAFWLLVPPAEVSTAGAWVELGVAYESARTIVCSGDTRRSVFSAIGHEEDTDEGAFAWLQAAFDTAPRSHR
jgi:hypothetical protein